MTLNNSYSIIIAIVLVLYLVLGTYPFSKPGRENFLISGRRLGGGSNGLSIASSKIGGGLLVSYSTLFFAFGWTAIFYFAGIIFGYLFFYLFAYKVLDESKENSYYTIADFFTHRFGRRVGLVVGVLTTFSALGWVFTNMVAGGIILGNIADIPPYLATGILALVIGFYLCFGGFNSVVKTDVIQYVAILSIAMLFAFLVGKLDFQGHEFQSSTMPPGQILSFFMLGILFPMGSGELWQRVYASRSKQEFKRSLLIASVSYVALGIFLSIICIKVLVVAPASLLSSQNEMKLTLGVVYLVEGIHPTLPYVWIIAYLSALISSADTFVYTTASSFVQDLLQKSRRINSEQVVPMIRLSIVVLLLSGVIVTYILPDVVSITFLFVGISLVITSLAFFSRLAAPGSSGISFYVSGLLGLSVVISHFIYLGFMATTVTALIGFCSSTIYMLLALIWAKFRKISSGLA